MRCSICDFSSEGISSDFHSGLVHDKMRTARGFVSPDLCTECADAIHTATDAPLEVPDEGEVPTFGPEDV